MIPGFSAPHIITLLTDFGTRDAFVGIMKGVILGIAPAVRLVDLSHEIPPQDILTGALILRSAVPFFPPGTIHVAVVDPGVGSQRRAIVVETREAWVAGEQFVGEDGLARVCIPKYVATNNALNKTKPHSFVIESQNRFSLSWAYK